MFFPPLTALRLLRILSATKLLEYLGCACKVRAKISEALHLASVCCVEVCCAEEAEYNETDFEHTWKAMEEVYQKGLAKSIGGSNLCRSQIEEIQDIADFSLDILQVDEEWFYEAPHVVDLCVQLGTPVTTYILHESPEMMKVVAHRGRGFFNSN
uniref:Aldo_ket_red domain-containing protein n=1 Tax=Bursaphelenchus xylophilus TaxID=6326 RepID=A0A1I7RTW7_BURXY